MANETTKTGRQNHSLLTRGMNRMVDCRCCGKRTHSSIDGCLGIELCRVCFDSAGVENEHSDYGHSTKQADCPTCSGLDCMHAAAEPKPLIEVRFFDPDLGNRCSADCQNTAAFVIIVRAYGSETHTRLCPTHTGQLSARLEQAIAPSSTVQVQW